MGGSCLRGDQNIYYNTVVSERIWHKPKDVLYGGPYINHLFGIVPSTLKLLYLVSLRADDADVDSSCDDGSSKQHNAWQCLVLNPPSPKHQQPSARSTSCLQVGPPKRSTAENPRSTVRQFWFKRPPCPKFSTRTPSSRPRWPRRPRVLVLRPRTVLCGSRTRDGAPCRG